MTFKIIQQGINLMNNSYLLINVGFTIEPSSGIVNGKSYHDTYALVRADNLKEYNEKIENILNIRKINLNSNNSNNNQYIKKSMIIIYPEYVINLHYYGTVEEVNHIIFTYFALLENVFNGRFKIQDVDSNPYTLEDFQRLKNNNELHKITQIRCIKHADNSKTTEDPKYNEGTNNENNDSSNVITNSEKKVNERSLNKTKKLRLKKVIKNNEDTSINPLVSPPVRKQINSNTLFLVVIISIGIFASLVRLYQK